MESYLKLSKKVKYFVPQYRKVRKGISNSTCLVSNEGVNAYSHFMCLVDCRVSPERPFSTISFGTSRGMFPDKHVSELTLFVSSKNTVSV